MFVACPWRTGNNHKLEDNWRYFLKCINDSRRLGEAPFGAHFYSLVSDATDDAQRNAVTSIARTWLLLKPAETRVVLYIDHGVSAGMMAEAAFALQNGIAVEYRKVVNEIMSPVHGLVQSQVMCGEDEGEDEDEEEKLHRNTEKVDKSDIDETSHKADEGEAGAWSQWSWRRWVAMGVVAAGLVAVGAGAQPFKSKE